MDAKFWDDMVKWVELMPDEEWAKILADFDKRVDERERGINNESKTDAISENSMND